MLKNLKNDTLVQGNDFEFIIPKGWTIRVAGEMCA